MHLCSSSLILVVSRTFGSFSIVNCCCSCLRRSVYFISRVCRENIDNWPFRLFSLKYFHGFRLVSSRCYQSLSIALGHRLLVRFHRYGVLFGNTLLRADFSSRQSGTIWIEWSFIRILWVNVVKILLVMHVVLFKPNATHQLTKIGRMLIWTEDFLRLLLFQIDVCLF